MSVRRQRLAVLAAVFCFSAMVLVYQLGQMTLRARRVVDDAARINEQPLHQEYYMSKKELVMGCFSNVDPHSTYLAASHIISPNPDLTPYSVQLTYNEMRDRLLHLYDMPYGVKNADQTALEQIVHGLERQVIHSTSWNQSNIRTNQKKCLVVGNGGILEQHHLGPEIDHFYDIVIRLNAAPVRGYEKIVGSRTDVRILSKMNALELLEAGEALENDTLLLFALMKPGDIPWLLEVVEDHTNNPFSQFKSKIALLNPKIVLETWQWLDYKFKPTTGLMALNYAFHTCTLVDIAGFSYGCDASAKLHYFREGTREDKYGGWKGLLTSHDHGGEGQLMKNFVRAGIVGDITGAYREVVPKKCINNVM